MDSDHAQWRIQSVRLTPPPPPPPPPRFETKLFHFHGEFSEIKEKITNNQVQLTNRTPFVDLNPQ